jgi:REP-associated tyrosine transposase
MARRAPRQLPLPLPSTWGGRRAGAGRKPAVGRAQVSHLVRPPHQARHPVHVTLRARPGLPSLRSTRGFSGLYAAVAAGRRRNFRIIHFSAQTDHVHLIVEAASRESLSRGVQGLAGRIARGFNRAVGRSGRVWSGRYHARPLTTAREVRNALVYVLLNFRKHLRAAPAIDPRSSGPWFSGWSRPPEDTTTAPPVSEPRTWLAAVGWRRAGGAIDPRECPA